MTRPTTPRDQRPERFDAAYYRRFYGRSPVQSAARVAKLAEGVLGMSGWWGIPVRSVLDVGAGPGHWGRWLNENRPNVRYRGVDVSAHACAKYGHELRDIARWHSPRHVDLVVCQGVLHYLENADAEGAIENLARSTRSLMYLEIPTIDDRSTVLDLSRTDLAAHWRPAQWYRDRLRDHFVELGCGLHYRSDGPALFFSLERSLERSVQRACPTG